MRAPLILVADDDRAVRSALCVNLKKANYEVMLAETVDAALLVLREHAVDVVISDVTMPGRSGLALLQECRTHWPDTRVVMMTGFGSVQDAVLAMKSGASEYLIKPIERDELLLLVERALADRATQRELTQLRIEVNEKYGFENMVGISPPMRDVYEQIHAVAGSKALVMITGETGTGKELIAHAIHYRSERSRGPMVAVNCGALPESLLESELFGHEKGAFTGASRQHLGKFEQCDGGTLFLDEIGEIPPSVQVKLLRVLEGGGITRVGGEREIKVDVRVICATNRDLRKEVQAGTFRADLYYRLNVFIIKLPPLRERREDIPLLVDHFVRRFAQRHNRRAPTLSSQAIRELTNYAWPGNIRELEHVLERAVLIAQGGEVSTLSLPEAEAQAPQRGMSVGPGGLPATLDHVERQLIIEALQQAGGVQARAAVALGISRSNLNYRIGRLNIRLQDITFG